MRLAFIFIIFVISGVIAGAQGEENIYIVQAIKRHAINSDGNYTYKVIRTHQEYADNKQFVHNDFEDIVDREFQEKVLKINVEAERKLYERN